MTPTLHLGRRFPLVARRRPACPPLDDRVAALERLTEDADNPAKATKMLNLAALLASDAGEHDLARTWCHEHARAWLNHLPGTAKDAIHALEPVVNLARLHIREDRGDEALALLKGLYEAVAHRRNSVLDGLHVPCSRLVNGDAAHREVLQWVWTVLLADGTRALTTAGRWQQALAHLKQHRGIGSRMADGRQVTVLARLEAGETDRAREMVEGTNPGRPWESAVTTTLSYMCTPDANTAISMVESYSVLDWAPGEEVFHTRLGLTVHELLGEDERAEQLQDWLTDRVLATGNGYCAREILESAGQTRRRGELRALVRSCGLGTRLSGGVRQRVEAAVDSCLDHSMAARPS